MDSFKNYNYWVKSVHVLCYLSVPLLGQNVLLDLKTTTLNPQNKVWCWVKLTRLGLSHCC